MILAGGKLYPSSEQAALLEGLEQKINRTLASETISPREVIDAIDTLGGRIEAGEFDEIIDSLGMNHVTRRIRGSVRLLRKEALTRRVENELGRDFLSGKSQPSQGIRTVPMPIGTLFHISAGNMDFLPAYTVAEGLLTGNVNILKLPRADKGLTVLALQKLIHTQPRLKNFIYVFDTPSNDLPALQTMADMADGIVVWGGDEAVRTARSLAAPGAKLIEWGHRLSFAYLSGHWRENQAALQALAAHIIETEQLLCSSCQTIFIDTDSMQEIRGFCRAFLPLLQEARDGRPIDDIGAAAAMTLKRYNDELEGILAGGREPSDTCFEGRCCGLTACEDKELSLSDLFGRCSVKRLPRNEIMAVLRAKKGYLQTVGLLCDPEERASLTNLLLRCGVNRVTSPGHMSEYFEGESHDGEYSLRRYVRMANVE